MEYEWEWKFRDFKTLVQLVDNKQLHEIKWVLKKGSEFDDYALTKTNAKKIAHVSAWQSTLEGSHYICSIAGDQASVWNIISIIRSVEIKCNYCELSGIRVNSVNWWKIDGLYPHFIKKAKCE